MPTTLPIIDDKARAATYANKGGTSRIGALGYRAWHEMRTILTSDDFRTVATFSLVGLLVGLLAMLSGVQGVWM
jgi:hypothetical protein